MQFSSDELKSIIGRKLTEATSYTLEDCDVACIMKPDQFGRGFLDEAKNQAECHKKSRFISAAEVVSVASTRQLNFSSFNPLKLEP